MLITIGNSSVSAKDVKRVSYYFHTGSQKGNVGILLSGGEIVEVKFDSESEAEANYQRFIKGVNDALKGW